MKLNSRNIGIITGLLMIVVSWCMAEYWNMPANGPGRFYTFLIFSVGLGFAIMRFHNRQQTPQRFKDYFSEGFKMFIVVTLFMAVYTYVYFKVNPEIMNAVIAESREFLLKGGAKTPDEIAQNEERIRQIFIPSMVIGSVIMNLLLGSLISLLGAAFLASKRKPEFVSDKPRF